MYSPPPPLRMPINENMHRLQNNLHLASMKAKKHKWILFFYKFRSHGVNGKGHKNLMYFCECVSGSFLRFLECTTSVLKFSKVAKPLSMLVMKVDFDSLIEYSMNLQVFQIKLVWFMLIWSVTSSFWLIFGPAEESEAARQPNPPLRITDPGPAAQLGDKKRLQSLFLFPSAESFLTKCNNTIYFLSMLG